MGKKRTVPVFPKRGEKMKELKFKVEGMVCGGCEQRVRNALNTIDGVKNVIADHTSGLVEVTAEDNVKEEDLKEKIEDIGFEVIEE